MHTVLWQPTRFSLQPPDGQITLSGGLKKKVNIYLCLKQHYVMKIYREVDLYLLGPRCRSEESFATVALPRQKASPGTHVPAEPGFGSSRAYHSH